MGQDAVMSIAYEALKVVLLVSMPLLLISMVVGLIISIFQATTQINEQTLAFVPKIVAIFAGIAVFGAWMITIVKEYTETLYMSINQYIK